MEFMEDSDATCGGSSTEIDSDNEATISVNQTRKSSGFRQNDVPKEVQMIGDVTEISLPVENELSRSLLDGLVINATNNESLNFEPAENHLHLSPNEKVINLSDDFNNFLTTGKLSPEKPVGTTATGQIVNEDIINLSEEFREFLTTEKLLPQEPITRPVAVGQMSSSSSCRKRAKLPPLKKRQRRKQTDGKFGQWMSKSSMQRKRTTNAQKNQLKIKVSNASSVSPVKGKSSKDSILEQNIQTPDSPSIIPPTNQDENDINEFKKLRYVEESLKVLSETLNSDDTDNFEDFQSLWVEIRNFLMKIDESQINEASQAPSETFDVRRSKLEELFRISTLIAEKAKEIATQSQEIQKSNAIQGVFHENYITEKGSKSFQGVFEAMVKISMINSKNECTILERNSVHNREISTKKQYNSEHNREISQKKQKNSAQKGRKVSQIRNYETMQDVSQFGDSERSSNIFAPKCSENMIKIGNVNRKNLSQHDLEQGNYISEKRNSLNSPDIFADNSEPTQNTLPSNSDKSSSNNIFREICIISQTPNSCSETNNLEKEINGNCNLLQEDDSQKTATAPETQWLMSNNSMEFLNLPQDCFTLDKTASAPETQLQMLNPNVIPEILEVLENDLVDVDEEVLPGNSLENSTKEKSDKSTTIFAENVSFNLANAKICVHESNEFIPMSEFEKLAPNFWDPEKFASEPIPKWIDDEIDKW